MMISGNINSVERSDGSMDLQTLRTRKGAISNQIASQILDLIGERHYKNGSRLAVIGQPVAQLQVGQASVREAIKLLDAWEIVIHPII
jgi:DNA-binding FadR family transcriptional regulator